MPTTWGTIYTEPLKDIQSDFDGFLNAMSYGGAVSLAVPFPDGSFFIISADLENDTPQPKKSAISVESQKERLVKIHTQYFNANGEEQDNIPQWAIPGFTNFSLEFAEILAKNSSPTDPSAPNPQQADPQHRHGVQNPGASLLPPEENNAILIEDERFEDIDYYGPIKDLIIDQAREKNGDPFPKQ